MTFLEEGLSVHEHGRGLIVIGVGRGARCMRHHLFNLKLRRSGFFEGVARYATEMPKFDVFKKPGYFTDTLETVAGRSIRPGFGKVRSPLAFHFNSCPKDRHVVQTFL